MSDSPGPAAAPREWDAATYDRIADPMTRWGSAVLERAGFRGDELILDAGCGTGRVTEKILERWPAARVIALDGSPAMVDGARASLARFGDRVEYVVADLGAPLPISDPVDAIVSTATFHWVADHDAMFRHLAAVLRPGGRLVAQFGGEGNIESIRAILASTGDGWLGPAHFESVPDTIRRLEAAGFTDVRAWLHPELTPIEPGEPLLTYLRTVILGAHLDRLPEDQREPFVRQVAGRMPTPLIDYVRLNMDARRAERRHRS
jgi:trans-aconitate 2-methyltransferase